MSRRLRWIALLLATAAAILTSGFLADARLLAAWRLATTLGLGLAVGSLMLIAIGRLLENAWRAAIEDELLPAAWLLPVSAALGLPLLLGAAEPPATIFGEAITAQQQAWFAPEARVARLAACLLAWLGALWLVTRSKSVAASGIAAALTTVGAVVAITDWIMLLPPYWWSRLLPFATMCSQLSAAIATAFVLNAVLPGDRGREPAFRSLAAALLGLALLTLWVWFAHYLTAWSVNLPHEALWYTTRVAGFGAVLLASAAALQLTAVLALITLRRRRGVLAFASIAILAAHGLHSLWWFRPAALRPPTTIDVLVGLPFAALLLAWLLHFILIENARLTARDAAR